PSAYAQPPISPLFPYTTLFRSPQPDDPGDRRGGEETLVAGVGLLHVGLFAPGPAEPDPLVLLAQQAFGTLGELLDLGGQQLRFGDRKSTRLNSSHVKISYAVFC